MEIEQVYKQIVSIAQEEGASKVVLFGSRARRTNLPKSDIDVAIAGCGLNFDTVCDRLQDEIWSLLSIDIINLDSNLSDELLDEIKRDGVVLYEKI